MNLICQAMGSTSVVRHIDHFMLGCPKLLAGTFGATRPVPPPAGSPTHKLACAPPPHAIV